MGDFRVNGSNVEVARAPWRGEHTEAILEQVGFSSEDVRELGEAGALRYERSESSTK